MTGHKGNKSQISLSKGQVSKWSPSQPTKKNVFTSKFTNVNLTQWSVFASNSVMLPSDVRDFAFASLSKDKDVYEWLYFFS